MYYGMSPDALQKLYVKDSLKNEDGGFSFELKNLIDSGSISQIKSLTVDGEEKPVDQVTIKVGEKTREASSITWSSSLYVSYGATLEIHVPGELEPGEHTIKITVNAPEIGQLTMPITDEIE
jgi:hypothetical protein